MPGWAVAQARDDTLDEQQYAPGAAPAPVPFWDAVSQNYDNSVSNGRLGARDDMLADAFQARHDEIERRLGQRFDFPRASDAYVGGADAVVQSPSPYIVALESGGQGDEPQIAAFRQRYPAQMADIPTAEQVRQSVDARLQAISQRAGLAGSQHPVAGFLGGAGGQFTDPTTLGLGLATGEAGAGLGLPLRMLAQSLIWGGLAAAEAPGRAAEAASVGGAPYGPGEAASDVFGGLMAGPIFEGGGALLKGALRPILGPLFERAFPQAEAIVRDVMANDPVARGAAMDLDAQVRDAFAVGPDRSGADFDAGVYALRTDQPPPMPEPNADVGDLFGNPVPPDLRAADAAQHVTDPPNTQGGGAQLYDQTTYRGRPIWAGRFDPGQVQAAPEVFQYKAGGDAAGVTDRLRGVQSWDPASSGKTIVWQAEDGKLYIADGHQRLGLAQRLQRQGFAPTLDGLLFRAADGWSAGEVRTIAALKNIREGQGTPLDAAKIFRSDPAKLNDDSLPVSGDFMRQAKGLARLSPEAFGAVVNRVIPENQGAMIGELAAARPDLHEGLVRLLHAGEPGNLDEAHAMIHEALLDDWVRQQGSESDLFGDTPAQSLAIARARLRAFIVRQLRGDARLFGQLVRHADAIEAGGNLLARDANEAKLATDQAALEIVAKLGMRAGDVGEAMTAAARDIAAGARVADAGKGVLARVRSALRRGERLDLGRAQQLDPDPPSARAQASAEAFAEPGGKGQEAQIAPKPEEAASEAASGGPARVTVGGAERPTVGTPLPARGLAPANLMRDGRVYVGAPNELHFQIAERFPATDGNEVTGTGFVTPDGQYLDRAEAAKWVRANEGPIRPASNMAGGLDALDYREQVPPAARAPAAAAGEPAAMRTSQLPEDDLFGGIEDDTAASAALEHLRGCAPG